jgi:hypothetical protein
MKDLGKTKQILNIEVYRDGKNGKLWLSLMRFNMNFVKPINIPLVFHCKLSSILCLGSKEEKDYMSRVQYSRKVDVCNVIFKYFTCSSCSQWTHDKTR